MCNYLAIVYFHGTLYYTASFGTMLDNAIGRPVGLVVLDAVSIVANAELSANTLNAINMVINLGAAVFFGQITMTNKLGRENEQKVRIIRPQYKRFSIATGLSKSHPPYPTHR